MGAMMNWHPRSPDSAPEPPAYDGPTTAARFVDEITAYRVLADRGYTPPGDLEPEQIKLRLFVGAKIDGRAQDSGTTRIVFADGSAAKLRRDGRWVTN